jgi:23S rRNA (adenine1618-N6)-methyltransferase
VCYPTTVQKNPKVQKSKNKTMHTRNAHRDRYDFAALIAACAELAPFVRLNIHNDESIDFANPEAVKMLNKALLIQHYDIQNWDIPDGYLCPPIPGRADYIHHIADVLRSNNYGRIPMGSTIKCLDIGVGANCIYPIIGQKAYGWQFVGADNDAVAVASAEAIIAANPVLASVEIRLQPNAKNIFKGIIQQDEKFDLTICNPPFHANLAEAQAGTLRKLSNLKKETVTEPVLNFGGQASELCYEGGEAAFIKNIVRESKRYGNSCFWFSTLVSKQANLNTIYDALEAAEAMLVETVAMGQGNKTSRIVAWTFLKKLERQAWRDTKWKL